MFDFIATINNDFPIVPKILAGVVIFGITYVVQHYLFRLVRTISNSDATPLPAGSILANIVRWTVWLTGAAIISKTCFNYDLTAFVTALGVGGIAVSLGFQDTLLNLFGGLQVSMGRLVEPGEYVEVLGQAGRVSDITWRHTVIVDANGCEHIIPNSLMNKNSLIHLSDTYTLEIPVLVPVQTDFARFSDQVVAKLRAAFPQHVDPAKVRVVFTGEEIGGMAGAVRVDVERGTIPLEEAQTRAIRAIDPLLKEAESLRLA
ncbi:mechanosensitive ion channel family protein [Hugonella massiliensis]|uniref:mechanosensitive ion channel family protein n=1 Tax=Hugonella massiliensis TaxID=1720315 RepID=UPI00073F2060|nr:mechanosensitive ion channel family protein [Hugonella massiliensis]MDD6729524.1 mechanosensitive ion channel family protein [Eggerthellaceae bacterium]